MKGFAKKRRATIREVLNTIRHVWNSPEIHSPAMDNSVSSSDYPSSPVFLRRRLSAPETVMRKHVLAQQRTEETTTSTSSCHQHWTLEGSTGSDTNLNKQRDCGLMRKSTLLRRMFSTKSKNSPEHRRSFHFSPKRTANSFSDSAYTNSGTNFPRSSFNSTCSSDIQKVVGGCAEEGNESAVKNPEVSTQTFGATNVNVISNVHLSQSTLDLIYSQVVRDVQNKIPDAITINTITSGQKPFYLKQPGENSKHSHIVKCMIGSVGAGSAYTAEVPQVNVPRLSALPHTTSMEVNESTDDKESDTVSLADSLEDRNWDESLPDNSNNNTKSKFSKPFSFFIPIDSEKNECPKSVSDHLPESVRERLKKRQIKRQLKAEQSRKKFPTPVDSNRACSSLFTDTSDVNSNTDFNSNRCKRRSKPTLPTIQTIRKIKFVGKDDSKYTHTTVHNGNNTTTKSSYWLPRTNADKVPPLCTTQKEYVYTARGGRIYHKTEMHELNKRIEILEIMECSERAQQNFHKGKSRIPVLVQNRLPKIPSRTVSEKPTFLDLKPIPISDAKIDQLIANILIDSLNNEETPGASTKTETTAHQVRRFEVIPEELSLQSPRSTEGGCDNANIGEGNNNNNEDEAKANYKGKEALNLVKDGNLAAIPQGWITFYMLQKSQGSSDEGKTDVKKTPENKQTEKDKSCSTTESEGNPKERILPQIQPHRLRKTHLVRRGNYRDFPRGQQRHPGGWSVTVSGTLPEKCSPNLEMRLKFGEATQRTSPKESSCSYATTKQGCDSYSNDNDASCIDSCRLPEIKPRFKRKTTLYEEPRHTKTSSRRILLHRPKQMPLFASDLNSEFDISGTKYPAMQLQEVLRRFPNFLSVIGNAINPKRKSTLYTSDGKNFYIHPN